MPSFSPMLRSVRRLYRRVAHSEETAAWQQVVETLGRVPVFRGLSRATLRDLADVVHSRRYKRDQVLYYQGDPGLGLYVVQRGSVRLVVEDEQHGFHELRHVREAGVFGELTVLGDFRRTETAQALMDTQVLGFFTPDLKALAKQNPKSGIAVLSALARYVAAQQVEVLNRVAEQQGPIAAMQLLNGAIERIG